MVVLPLKQVSANLVMLRTQNHLPSTFVIHFFSIHSAYYKIPLNLSFYLRIMHMHTYTQAHINIYAFVGKYKGHVIT